MKEKIEISDAQVESFYRTGSDILVQMLQEELERIAKNPNASVDQLTAVKRQVEEIKKNNLARLQQPDAPPGPRIVDAMASSAARKEEKHFSVPVHDKPAESLITKPLAPLDVAAKEAIKLRVKTIRHSDCVEVGKDHFDEVVTRFLEKVGETHLVSITPITYMHQDLASRQWIDDYGVLLVYRG